MYKENTLRDPAFLDWIRDQPCISCGKIPEWGDRNQASHIGTSNFKIKPPDDQVVPQCGQCHYIYEYHKDIFEQKTGAPLPTLEDCARYYSVFLQSKAGQQSES